MVDTTLTLGYWGGFRGLAEGPRLFLEYTGTKYHEKFYKMEEKEAWFAEDKQKLNFDFPNLPYIVDGTEKVTESEAVILYVILKSGKTELLGKTVKDQVTVATLKGVAQDTFTDLVKLMFNPEHEKHREETFKTKVWPRLDQFEKFVSGKKFFLGDYITTADFKIYVLLKMVHGVEASVCDKYPNLKAFVKNFSEVPELQSYLKSDRNKEQNTMPAFCPLNSKW